MIDELMTIPSVIFTHVNKSQQAYFQYWQRQAQLNQQRDVCFIYVLMAFEMPSVDWISSVNLQLISLDIPIFLSLTFMDKQWWLAQSFMPGWKYCNEQDKQRFLTQFAVAEWLENEERKQPRQLHRPGNEVQRCIF